MRPLPPRDHVDLRRAALVNGASPSNGELLMLLAFGLLLVAVGTKMVRSGVSQLGWSRLVADAALSAVGSLAA